MKLKKGVNISEEKYIGLPLIFFNLNNKGFGFYFLIDTSIRKNLIDPCFYKEWIDYTPSPATSDDPNSGLAYYPGIPPPPHEKVGTKRVMCKDGVRKVCEVVKLHFTIEGKEYSEQFALDSSLCRYFHFKKSKFAAGVLGTEFLKKHKWVLDFSEMEQH